MMEKGTKLRAFIAAPSGEPLDVLKEELAKRNVQAFTAYDLPPATGSIATHIEDAIKKSDLMVAIVAERASSDVFFELGMAYAMKKQLLVLVSPEFGILPSDISGTLYLRIDQKNRDALSFALDQCIHRLEKPPARPKKEKEQQAPLGEEANQFLAALQDKELKGFELERLVAEILQTAGVEAVIESQHRDVGADLAIWSDSLQPITGNPILVEVKQRIRSRAELQRALQQVENYRQKSGSKLALLLVNVAMVPLASAPVAGGVLAVLLSDLVDRLRTRTLAEAIRELRNEAAHGGAK
jgi:hypothetical protein